MTEQTTTFTTTTDTLNEAFAFVMDHLPASERPRVTISPVSTISAESLGNSEWSEVFNVTVSWTETVETREVQR